MDINVDEILLVENISTHFNNFAWLLVAIFMFCIIIFTYRFVFSLLKSILSR